MDSRIPSMSSVKHSITVRITSYSFLGWTWYYSSALSPPYCQILANLCRCLLTSYCKMLTSNSGLLCFENHISNFTGDSLTPKSNRFFRIRGESMSNFQNRISGVCDHFSLQCVTVSGTMWLLCFLLTLRGGWA